MFLESAIKFRPIDVNIFFCQLLLIFFISSVGYLSIHAQNNIGTLNDKNVLVIDEIKDGEVFAFGKTILIKKEVKGVLVLGGDIIIEGKVEGDVATIGGSVFQKENGFIGGDVIIFGGKYQHERNEPLRNINKETIMYAGYEEELRDLTQNPTQIFSPQLTWAFLGWRLLSVLFWFIVSLLFTTIAPGAISRAVARIQLSSLKIVGLGLAIFITTTIAVIASLSFLPTNISGIISIMFFVLVSLAYFFGRVSLQVSFGKWLQKHLLKEKYHSDSTALFLGSLMLVIGLSVPYIWTIALVLIFSASLGLVFTAKIGNNWRAN